MLTATVPAEAWNDYNTVQPSGKGLFCWRVAPRMFGREMFRPEFVAEHSRRLDVGSNPIFVPQFAHWDGWKHVLPRETQWAYLDGLEEGDFLFPGLDLKTCPFCGQMPKMCFSPPWIGAMVHLSHEFWIECRCRLAKTPRFGCVRSVAEVWNERA